ncbi:MAG TPA: MBL fold metallo-hydrolase [Acetobacteraceae bacterium]|jgi:L-ascorbate metabolism protein UlaG (beta-lactamase superfamily)|nr:MBL fold metallo-hydrolase [Acetobacteraceae bacterium]
MLRRPLAAALAALLILIPRLVLACGVSAQAPLNPFVSLASYAPEDETAGVKVQFLGHASFLLETPQHVTIVTDYNGYNIPRDPPVIATMNHAHSTHYTMNPDPRIKYVLHGWMEDGKIPQFDLTVGDVHVRNLPTNIRDWNGGTEYYGNSIFVFETAGLCIAHLSHLHHLLTDEDVATLGPLDIVMMPVDGVWTMNHEDIAKVMTSLHAPLYIPFHYFGDEGLLERFLHVVDGQYTVKRAGAATATLSRETLPVAPEILILQGPPG